MGQGGGTVFHASQRGRGKTDDPGSPCTRREGDINLCCERKRERSPPPNKPPHHGNQSVRAERAAGARPSVVLSARNLHPIGSFCVGVGRECELQLAGRAGTHACIDT